MSVNRQIKSLFLLPLLPVILSVVSYAQPPPLQFQHLSDDLGLSNNRVWAITQDAYGFIWIGTGDGLNRFDGYKVEVYRNEPGNKNSLPGNLLRCLFTDSQGTMWVGTSNGLAFYDKKKNSFQSFFHNRKDPYSLPHNSISVIKEDAYGTLWIGTNAGLCSLDKKKNRFQPFLHNKQSNSISDNFIRDVEFTQEKMMWISTGRGLNRLDLSTMKFTSFFHVPGDSTTLSGNTLTKMAIDKQGKLWVSVNETVYLECFDTKTLRVRHFKNLTEKESDIPSNHPRDIFVDRSGRLWIGTDAGGLYHFLPGENRMHQYNADLLDPDKLQSNTVVGMFQDRSGMIWLATYNGVERFNPSISKFAQYRPKPKGESAVKNSVQAIAEDLSGRLWIGTFNGIFILEQKTGKYVHYKWNKDDPNSIRNNVIQSLSLDKNGEMWVGTMSGLNKFDSRRNNFRKYFTEKDTSSAISFIHSIISTKNGDLFIGGPGGLFKYNFENDSVHRVFKDGIRIIFEDNRGILWLGRLNKGVIKYNRGTGELKQFTHNFNDTSSIISNSVHSITQDHDGKMWIATGAGLCLLDEATGKFTRYTEKDGLPNVHVAQLMVDEKNRIWMSTNKGISMLNTSRTKFTNYDLSDGLQGWEFSPGSAFKTQDGYLCYAGKNGFNIFHPDSLKQNDFKPPLVLTRVMIFDKPLKMDSSYSDLKSLKLSYKQNFFSFEFAALNYDHPEKNQYACQLIGFDEKMVQLGTNRVINYTNVPPGHYILKVIASNNDGIMNQEGFELALDITPPFWATWWFRTIMIISFIGSILVFFKRRENRIRKEQLRQTAINKQIAEIRMTALRAQMNPHFIFNSLNSIQHFITIREKEEALNYLSKFSKLIRMILENSRENTVSIRSELQLLELYIQLEQLRFSHKFDYQITVADNIDTENTEIPPLLIQPFIENAILHGLISKDGKGNLSLCVEKNNGSLVFKIEDNGIGREMAEKIEKIKVSKHTSLGITVTNERISELFTVLNYKTEVLIEDLFERKNNTEEVQAAGTRVTIYIPVIEEQ